MDSQVKSEQQLNVDVVFDATATGDQRCVVSPETISIPAGRTRVLWTLRTVDRSSDSPILRIADVRFVSPAVPEQSSSMDNLRWQAVFDRSGPGFGPMTYEVDVNEGPETVICYPHIKGSPDQGGSGGGGGG